ncbi:hypothetical protein [Curtobacterium sp. MCSS17_015]|uniref:hypothetical protein n=1 Tax=Curtobacterium sp. MCSS17_015 TaxID=2175666 RepID=UPI000DAAA6A3|nr:hypothetical protein [Curtobacterium sp. MCSS17_015]WIB25770.1 hypothetical protein DEJ18_12025 [Curtobacterium sp. MCSS17_015]
MKNQHLVRLGSAALAFGIVTTTVAGSLLMVTAPASATAPTDSSAMTLTWKDAQAALGGGQGPDAGTPDPDASPDPDADAFSEMTFTVSQTKDLTDQGITVSWTGAEATSPSEYATDYVQIMQCWGDDPAGPSPQQCVWGAPSAAVSARTGVGAAKRDLVRGDDPVQDTTLVGERADADLMLEPPVENPFLKAYRMPFRAVDGTLAKTSTELSKQFDANTSNEVTAGRTASDGTGQVTFETQSALEAPQLGCGQEVVVAGTSTPRSCWLVVVPRGSHNLDGSAADSTAAGRVTGSPLSASAWRNRVVFPLGFQSVAQSCPIGNAEERLVGSETATEAVTAWQPALCGLGTTYGFSQIGDGEAANQIVSDVAGSSRLALVTSPLAETAAAGKTIRYAPVAQSAVVIAFTIDYRLYPDAPAKVRDGLQALDLTLDARLVAKLLTQSYQADVPGRGSGNTVLQANAASLVTDPEFLALNPTFVGSKSDTAPAGLMVALGNADANARVWSWLRSDPVAAAFLDGRPDEWGMRINPAYRSLALATDPSVDSFPKADLTIAKGGDPDETGYGTLDMRPYMNDMHEGAYRALKADPNEKDSWNPFGQPKGYTSLGAQVPGSRFVLTITDAASAARYGLPTAKLVNGAGEAVAPTAETVAAGVGTMRASTVPGVVVADPADRTPGAYPLSMLSYAAVNVCAATPEERRAYSGFIAYAAGKGQVQGERQGELPAGYVPLPAAMTTQSKTVAADLLDARAVAAACPAASAPEPTAPETDVPTASAPDDQPAPLDPVGTGTTSTDTVATPEVPAVQEPSSNDVDQAAADGPDHRTTDQPLAATRMGLAAALGAGVPALGIGPFLIRRGRRLAMLAAAHV